MNSPCFLYLLSKNLVKLETLRDQVAHGIWMKGKKGEILLQSLTGNWLPDPKEKKVARRIKPEGIDVGLKDLKELSKLICLCTKAVHVLGKEVDQLLAPSRKISPRQSDPDRLHDDPNSDTSEPPPKSSAA